MKKLFIIIGTMLIIIILMQIQINLLNDFSILGVIPNIGIVFVCALGIVDGKSLGALIGASYGLLVDVTFGRALGVFTIMYLIIGMMAGYLKNKISKDNKLSLVFMVFFTTIVFEVINSIISTMLYNIDFDFFYLIKIIAIEEVYNMFITFVLFRPLIYWGEYINRSMDSYYLLH